MPTSQVEGRLASLQTLVVGGLAAIVVFAIFVSCVLLWLSFDAGNRAAKADEQLRYLCETTLVLDDLVVAARDQIQLNFDNGTYARLVKTGVLTQENVDAARDTLAQYKASHDRLLAAPC